MPGELRLWGETFEGENPELLRKSFLEHIKRSPFMPKPCDISELIGNMRRSMMPREEKVDYEAIREHQQTQEFKEASDKARAMLKKCIEGIDANPFRPKHLYIPTTAELAEELKKTEHLRGLK